MKRSLLTPLLVRRDVSLPSPKAQRKPRRACGGGSLALGPPPTLQLPPGKGICALQPGPPT
jgi:hypothetical protein